MNATQKRVTRAFYYGARDIKQVYQNAGDSKVNYWFRLKELEAYYNGEMRILSADRRGFTAGILYSGDDCKSHMVFVKDSKCWDFIVGDYVKVARRIKAHDTNKVIEKAWRFN